MCTWLNTCSEDFGGRVSLKRSCSGSGIWLPFLPHIDTRKPSCFSLMDASFTELLVVRLRIRCVKQHLCTRAKTRLTQGTHGQACHQPPNSRSRHEQLCEWNFYTHVCSTHRTFSWGGGGGVGVEMDIEQWHRS